MAILHNTSVSKKVKQVPMRQAARSTLFKKLVALLLNELKESLPKSTPRTSPRITPTAVINIVSKYTSHLTVRICEYLIQINTTTRHGAKQPSQEETLLFPLMPSPFHTALLRESQVIRGIK